jgi:methylated-DNA-[protein]-cysteine S-methyltransferase
MTKTTRFTVFDAPFGPLCLLAYGDARGLGALQTDGQKGAAVADDCWVRDDASFTDAVRQLTEYFEGRRTRFDVPLDLHQGTDFQRDVWQALRAIPFGATVAYSDVARSVGRPAAVRAVGAAIGKNPWGIIVPCHRVVGRAGALTGFAGGVPTKRWLLQHEGVAVGGGRDAADPKARARGPQTSFAYLAPTAGRT